MDLAPGESKSLDFTWTPATGGPHTLRASLVLVGDENVENNSYTKEGVNVLSPAAGAGPLLQVQKVTAYTDHWMTVELSHNYGEDMVVVCSPNYDLSAPGPAMVRVRNARGTSFDSKARAIRTWGISRR